MLSRHLPLLVKSVHKGLESSSYLGPKSWALLPVEIKETNYSKLRLKSEIPKTDHVVFAKHTCRMLDSFRLINSVNIFLSWISLSDKSWWAISYLFAWICKDSLTEGSGFCSETIAFILNCICVYKPVYFRVYLFAFRLA